MTQASKLKQAIRQRAARTGESYTTARLHVLRKRDGTTATPATPPLADTIPASSPATIQEDRYTTATGVDLATWLLRIDAFAAEHGPAHAPIARWLGTDHQVDGWWSQAITVAWERARGHRVLGQTASGFQVAVSRTLRRDLADLEAWLAEPGACGAWLASVDPALGEPLAQALDDGALRSRPGKDLKLRWRVGDARLELEATARTGACALTVRATHLPDEAARDQWQALLRHTLDALRDEFTATP